MATKKSPPVTFDSVWQRPPPGLLATDADRDEWEALCAVEDFRRLWELCRFYGVTPGDWYGLALALARQRYRTPGKREVTKWDVWRGLVLVAEVEKLTDQHPDDSLHGAAWACQQLANREPWRSFMDEGRKADERRPEKRAKALLKVYEKHKNKHKDEKGVSLWRHAFAAYRDKPGAWDEFVRYVVRDYEPNLEKATKNSVAE